MDKTKEFKYIITATVNQLKSKSDTALFQCNRDLFNTAATLICELQDRLVAAERDRASMAAVLKEAYGCSCCKHWCIYSICPSYHPCASCREGNDKPHWEWKGA